ncbi:nuclear protein ORF-K [Elephant endotheliotropic herpesvirus 3A]|uniref:Nuclear protein ORF-K n=1 Tax=Elephant endotheliotropic herpesvirus 3A TaxID=1329409 RepID=A0A866VSZ5_9BETA|nr:nuclear protein ORF-K [Elephant endotheliotropic herpesvirus 3A]QOE74472.1 nuclear protein ORF-K [Elephant endotheliotropic herpesvirus 3A]
MAERNSGSRSPAIKVGTLTVRLLRPLDVDGSVPGRRHRRTFSRSVYIPTPQGSEDEAEYNGDDGDGDLEPRPTGSCGLESGCQGHADGARRPADNGADGCVDIRSSPGGRDTGGRTETSGAHKSTQIGPGLEPDGAVGVEGAGGEDAPPRSPRPHYGPGATAGRPAVPRASPVDAVLDPARGVRGADGPGPVAPGAVGLPGVQARVPQRPVVRPVSVDRSPPCDGHRKPSDDLADEDDDAGVRGARVAERGEDREEEEDEEVEESEGNEKIAATTAVRKDAKEAGRAVAVGGGEEETGERHGAAGPRGAAGGGSPPAGDGHVRRPGVVRATATWRPGRADSDAGVVTHPERATAPSASSSSSSPPLSSARLTSPPPSSSSLSATTAVAAAPIGRDGSYVNDGARVERNTTPAGGAVQKVGDHRPTAIIDLTSVKIDLGSRPPDEPSSPEARAFLADVGVSMSGGGGGGGAASAARQTGSADDADLTIINATTHHSAKRSVTATTAAGGPGGGSGNTGVYTRPIRFGQPRGTAAGAAAPVNAAVIPRPTLPIIFIGNDALYPVGLSPVQNAGGPICIPPAVLAGPGASTSASAAATATSATFQQPVLAYRPVQCYGNLTARAVFPVGQPQQRPRDRSERPQPPPPPSQQLPSPARQQPPVPAAPLSVPSADRGRAAAVVAQSPDDRGGGADGGVRDVPGGHVLLQPTPGTAATALAPTTSVGAATANNDATTANTSSATAPSPTATAAPTEPGPVAENDGDADVAAVTADLQAQPSSPSERQRHPQRRRSPTPPTAAPASDGDPTPPPGAGAAVGPVGIQGPGPLPRLVRDATHEVLSQLPASAMLSSAAYASVMMAAATTGEDERRKRQRREEEASLYLLSEVAEAKHKQQTLLLSTEPQNAVKRENIIIENPMWTGESRHRRHRQRPAGDAEVGDVGAGNATKKRRLEEEEQAATREAADGAVGVDDGSRKSSPLFGVPPRKAPTEMASATQEEAETVTGKLYLPSSPPPSFLSSEEASAGLTSIEVQGPGPSSGAGDFPAVSRSPSPSGLSVSFGDKIPPYQQPPSSSSQDTGASPASSGVGGNETPPLSSGTTASTPPPPQQQPPPPPPPPPPPSTGRLSSEAYLTYAHDTVDGLVRQIGLVYSGLADLLQGLGKIRARGGGARNNGRGVTTDNETPLSTAVNGVNGSGGADGGENGVENVGESEEGGGFSDPTASGAAPSHGGGGGSYDAIVNRGRGSAAGRAAAAEALCSSALAQAGQLRNVVIAIQTATRDEELGRGYVRSNVCDLRYVEIETDIIDVPWSNSHHFLNASVITLPPPAVQEVYRNTVQYFLNQMRSYGPACQICVSCSKQEPLYQLRNDLKGIQNLCVTLVIKNRSFVGVPSYSARSARQLMCNDENFLAAHPFDGRQVRGGRRAFVLYKYALLISSSHVGDLLCAGHLALQACYSNWPIMHVYTRRCRGPV